MSISIKSKSVLISGASIAGPTLAYWLNTYGFNVTVVEKAPVLRSGGYRIDVRGKAVDVVERMGVMPAIRKVAPDVRGTSIINSKGKRIVDFDDPNVFGMRQANDAEIMRGDLANILYDVTKDEVEYIFNDSIFSITETGENIKVTFRNTPARTFDIVVGADGLHSNVRSLAFGNDNTFVKNFNYYISIFSIPNFFHLEHWELSYFLTGKIINVYNIDKHHEAKALFMFASDSAFIPQDPGEQKKMLTDHFKDAGWEVAKMLETLRDSEDFYFDSMSQVYMDSLSKGRIVLLGDAGYCPSPASGQGTSLALIGAYILAGELASSQGNYPVAFGSYEQQMRGFIDRNQKLAVENLKQMVPKTKAELWMRNNMMRLFLSLPWRKKILKGLLKKIQNKVDEAANAITLKDYTI